MPIIESCPICGTDYGVTHGDQHFIKIVCEACREAEEEENEKQWKLKRSL